jgi:hypothetical protein
MCSAAQRRPRCRTALPLALPHADPRHSLTATALEMVPLKLAVAGGAMLPLAPPPLVPASATGRRRAGKAARTRDRVYRYGAEASVHSASCYTLPGHALPLHPHDNQTTSPSPSHEQQTGR